MDASWTSNWYAALPHLTALTVPLVLSRSGSAMLRFGGGSVSRAVVSPISPAGVAPAGVGPAGVGPAG